MDKTQSLKIISTGCRKRDASVDEIFVSVYNKNSVSLQVTVTLFNHDKFPMQVDDQRIVKIPGKCTAREIFVTTAFVNYEVQIEIPDHLIGGIEVLISVPEIIFAYNTKVQIPFPMSKANSSGSVGLII